MKLRTLFSLFVAVAGLARLQAASAPAPAAAPVRALLITGGCCHDYPTQTRLLTDAVKAHGAIELTVINEGGRGTRGMIALYDNPDWAKPYDVVIHNECFADTDSLEYVQKITAAHKAGKPAVVVHCAMHTYRAAKFDDWREFLGVTSRRHDHQSEYTVTKVDASHPTMKDFPDTWKAPRDELYIIEKLWPNAKSLAKSTSEVDGKEHPVIWVNNYHGARVFGTTFGHNTGMWADPVFAKLIARGVFWAAGRE